MESISLIFDADATRTGRSTDFTQNGQRIDIFASVVVNRELLASTILHH